MKKTINILHIDDSFLDRSLVKDVLHQESSEFVLFEADTREKFESLISEQEFDVVLSDFNILGFDGLQVLEIVRKINPELPVIIVTGTGSEEVAIKAMKMGAADYVIKSVKHIRSLPHVIKSVLEHKQKEIELNRTQNALLKSEALFRTAFENATIGVCMVDVNGNFISVNETLCKITGYSKSELEKSSFMSITHPSDIDKSKYFLNEILKGNINNTNFEKRYVHKSGNIIWAIISTSLVKNSTNNTEYFFTFIQDISEKKKFEEELIKAKEKAEEADRLKTAFLNNISHEIRTPMNAIIGFSELLNEPDLDKDKHKEYTNTIMQSSEHLLSIISDIISIATIEAGQEKIHQCEYNLNEMLDLMYDQFKIKADEKNLEFKIAKTLSDREATISTDKTKLIQIISNLINNSLKFTDIGFIEVSYVLEDTQLVFTVKDSGIGIPKNMHDEVFKRFRQIEYSSDRQHGGSGLGLAISRAYIELLGGKIWLNSEPNVGTSFFFTIPYKVKPQPKLTTSSKKSEDPMDINKNIKNILIAEDDDSNFLLIKTFLSDNNINIIRVKTGVEAVEICKNKTDIDLILMDIKMPKENGLEAIKKIRKFNTQIPIIIESAYYDDSNREEAFAAGCNDFITKPIKKHNLIAVINKLFD
ncbi:MAG TPA: response regulator [Bacteroidales bacterium]|nr:response regulator [Bacteroidales bacterium]